MCLGKVEGCGSGPALEEAPPVLHRRAWGLRGLGLGICAHCHAAASYVQAGLLRVAPDTCFHWSRDSWDTHV